MNTVIAKVLWVDTRDGYGIVQDDAGNEYYIDISACKRRELPIRSQLVRGEVNEAIQDTLCLKNVRDFLDTSAE